MCATIPGFVQCWGAIPEPLPSPPLGSEFSFLPLSLPSSEPLTGSLLYYMWQPQWLTVGVCNCRSLLPETSIPTCFQGSLAILSISHVFSETPQEKVML